MKIDQEKLKIDYLTIVPMKQLSLALRSARKSAGYTIPEFAEKSGLSMGTISRVEKGLANITSATIDAYEAALEFQFYALLSLKPQAIKRLIDQQ